MSRRTSQDIGKERTRPESEAASLPERVEDTLAAARALISQAEGAIVRSRELLQQMKEFFRRRGQK